MQPPAVYLEVRPAAKPLRAPYEKGRRMRKNQDEVNKSATSSLENPPISSQ
jgi:hypothetical protein